MPYLRLPESPFFVGTRHGGFDIVITTYSTLLGGTWPVHGHCVTAPCVRVFSDVLVIQVFILLGHVQGEAQEGTMRWACGLTVTVGITVRTLSY